MYKRLLSLLLLLPSASAWSQSQDGQAFDWSPVIEAIATVESGRRADARNGQYVGILQISPVMVRECNNILRRQASEQRFTNADRLSPEKSGQMFRVFMSKYNPENDIDKACRLWKGGIGYSVKKTQRFVNRVRAVMKKQQRHEKKK